MDRWLVRRERDVRKKKEYKLGRKERQGRRLC